MAKIATVGGITGLGFLALSLGLPEMIEGLSNEVSYGLAIVGGILVLTAFVWSLLSKRDDGGSSTNQTTHGPHSPNIGSVGGNVTFVHGVQDATQHPKSPYGSGHSPRATEQAAEYIARHLRMAEAYPPGLATVRVNPKPDLNFNGLMVRVYKRLGGSPPTGPSRKEFWSLVDREVADKMSLNNLHAWGRMSPNQALREIDPSTWAEGLFDHRDKALFMPSGLHTVEYSDLHFWAHEIDRIWPKPPETTNDRSS